jgi:aryl-alcohol dehydrogenase-like predicted oxidoreductase
MNQLNRRDFISSAALAAAALHANRALAQSGNSPQPPASGPVPMRPFGKSESATQVSALGLGGYHLGSASSQQEATEIVARAMDAGVNFFDNCWDYHDGESEERLGQALKGRRQRAFVMTKVCTHGRDKATAMRQLEQSLRRLQTDYLDLWQIHEVVYFNDPDLIFAPNGAAEALLEAKRQGKVRHIGFTGHKDPSIHLKMLSHDFPFDSVQMPLNCLDATYRSFEQQVLPEVNRRGIAALGMKSFGGSGEIIVGGAATPHEALRYAMSLPVTTTISGVDSLDVLEQNLAIASNFKPMSSEEMQSLRERCRGLAADGRFELFKSTKKYDGKEGREQHMYPSAEELPA